MIKLNLLPEPVRRPKKPGLVKTQATKVSGWLEEKAENIMNDIVAFVMRQTFRSVIRGILRLAIIFVVCYYIAWPIGKGVWILLTGLGLFSQLLVFVIKAIGLAVGLVTAFCVFLILLQIGWYVIIWAFSGKWVFHREKWSE